eukprot:TRINITY_DN11562_c0_g1_i16.p3 TRINITY_DN11562_c0_g1~~TRINITY_DN11562_c0_g1_i16.p3  ORF type:complete len:104 (-),score=16.26 TRINITY_DN11562_c0_g1_i16:41-352(-)
MKFTSKRIQDPEASMSQSIKISQTNTHETVLRLGFNFKSAFSLMFNKQQANAAQEIPKDYNTAANLKEVSANPLATAAKTALMRCKYISVSYTHLTLPTKRIV